MRPHIFMANSMKKAYFVLILVYLSGIAAPINQFKVPPVLGQLMSEFGISLGSSGWLMSVFALAGFVCALPAGGLIKRIGVKNAGITALAILLTGSVLGFTANTAFVLLASRVLEGVGMCIFAVTAPAAISAWFPPDKRGIPMGLWATWVPVGTIVAFTVAPFINKWENVWLFSLGYTILVLSAFAVFFTIPSGKITVSGGSAAGKILKSREIWMLAAIFMLFNVATISVKSYMPAFLETIREYTPLQASGFTSIMMICSMITAPLAGVISDRIASRKKPVVLACVFALIALLGLFHFDGALLCLFFVMLGIAGGAMPAGLFTAATELADRPDDAGLYSSVVILGQYAGMFAGPVFFSSIAGSFGWFTAGWALVPLPMLALVISLRLKIK